MPSRELTNVVVEMLDTHPMVGAVVASFYHGPERFHAVDVRQFVDILANTILEHLVIVSMKIRVTLEVIRIDVFT